MARSRIQPNDLSPWEKLGAFFGYFAVANDVPEILRTLSVRSLVPDNLKKCLLEFNSNPDFWYLISFTLVVFVGLLSLLRRKDLSKENQDEDTKSKKDSAIYKELQASMKRMRKISILRSLGLVIVREWILNRFKISLYGTFKRPSEWEEQPERFDYIDRINYVEGDGYEFQYSRDFKQVIVRKHPFDNSTYGSETMRPPTWEECLVLIFASNYFPFWFLIHLFKRGYTK